MSFKARIVNFFGNSILGIRLKKLSKKKIGFIKKNAVERTALKTYDEINALAC